MMMTYRVLSFTSNLPTASKPSLSLNCRRQAVITGYLGDESCTYLAVFGRGRP